MLFIHDSAQWLDEVDPWTDREAIDLLNAVRHCRTVGLFHCSSSADGCAYFVMTAHASGALVLPTREAWQAFVLEIARRCGLAIPLLTARAPGNRFIAPRPRHAASAA